MTSISAIIRNIRPIEGRAYIAIIGFSLLMNIKGVKLLELVMAFLAGVLFVWYAFSINNCFDVDTDSRNPMKVRKNPIASGELSLKEGLLLSVLLALTGAGLTLKINFEMFIVYLAMILLATMYSAPPRLKGKPIVDVLSHGLFFGGLSFIYGSIVDGNLSNVEMLMAIGITFYSFALELRNHLEDYESDLMAGLRTTPIVIGRARSELLVEIFSLLAITVVLYAFKPHLIVAPSLMVVGRGLGIRPQTVYRMFDIAMIAALLITGGTNL
ncbi:UbiA prenyltransferase family protein [Pyrococcus kukulkanii]|uniref:UbiA prenyltransferase family protein n=1 Tax=Pyrococcus kukulkanii TaxID=1609559 RepID=UPI0035638F90